MSTERKNKQRSVQLSDELWDQLCLDAAREDRTASSLIRIILMEYYMKQEAIDGRR